MTTLYQGGPRGVGDVPHRDRAESAGRRIRAAGRRRDTVVDDVGDRGVGAGPRRAGRRALRRLPALPAGRHRHDAGATARRRSPARAWDRCARGERLLLAVFSLVLLLWLASEWIALSATAVACFGVAMLLLTRVLDWKDILEEKGAWDALIWFGGLVMLPTQLAKAGFPQAFAPRRAGLVARLAVVVGARRAADHLHRIPTTRSRAWWRT